jgi:hypothetical protein
MPVPLHYRNRKGGKTPLVLFLDPFFFETTKGNQFIPVAFYSFIKQKFTCTKRGRCFHNALFPIKYFLLTQIYYFYTGILFSIKHKHGISYSTAGVHTTYRIGIFITRFFKYFGR